jgi:hypothetical protein
MVKRHVVTLFSKHSTILSSAVIGAGSIRIEAVAGSKSPVKLALFLYDRG